MALNLWQCNFFVIWSNFEKVRNFLVLLLQTFQRQHIKILPHSDNCHCINFSLLFGINWCRTVRNFDCFFTQTTLRFISSLKKREQQLLPIHSKKCHVLNLDGNYYASSVITLLRGGRRTFKRTDITILTSQYFLPPLLPIKTFLSKGKMEGENIFVFDAILRLWRSNSTSKQWSKNPVTFFRILSMVLKDNQSSSDFDKTFPPEIKIAVS